MDQSNFFEIMAEFHNETRPEKEDKEEKRNNFDSITALYERPELTLNAFRSAIFPIKETKGNWLKMLTPKQMLQWLPKALAQVKVGNTSENLFNEIRQIIYCVYPAEEVIKKVHDNIKFKWLQWELNPQSLSS